MKRTFSFFLKKNALWGLLLAVFMLAGVNSSNAQSNAGGNDNPEITIAQKFNVTAYDLGTFDKEETIAALSELAADLQSQVNHSSPMTLRLKFKYVTQVLSDVETYSIAPEISLLKRLSALETSTRKAFPSNNGTISSSNTTPVQYSNLYNEIVNELQ